MNTNVSFYDRSNVFSVAHLPFVHAASARDEQLRPACITLAKNYLASIALVKGLRNLIDCRAHRAKLAADGYSVTDEQFVAAYETQSTEEEKVMIDQVYERQIFTRLQAGVKEHVDRIAAVALRILEADLEQLSVIEPVLKKYEAPRSPLNDAIINAIARLRAAMANPVDLSWHPDRIMALSQSFFPEDAPLVLDSPAPAHQVPATPPSALSSLRTAAEVAAAR